jgi:hypothetical protein
VCCCCQCVVIVTDIEHLQHTAAAVSLDHMQGAIVQPVAWVTARAAHASTE